jgi:transcription termination factor NusB
MLKSRSLKFQRFRQRNNNNRSRSRNNVLLALYSHRRSSSVIDDFKENSEEEIRTVLKSDVSKNHGRDRQRHELGPQLINNISSSSGSVGNNISKNNYQYASTANASMRYIDRSFVLLERVMKPSVFLVLLTSFVGVVFCVFFAALYGRYCV